MARTAGSFSLASVQLKELVRRIAGKEVADQIQYEGFITVGRNWMENFFGAECEMVYISRDALNAPFVRQGEDGNPIEPLQIERAIAPQEVLAKSKPQKFAWNPDED